MERLRESIHELVSLIFLLLFFIDDIFKEDETDDE
jgi:hypothetical protein